MGFVGLMESLFNGLLMGTDPIIVVSSKVAVKTESTKSLWKIIFYQPAVKYRGTGTNLTAMIISTTVNVVNIQKTLN